MNDADFPGPVVRTAPATLAQYSQWYEQQIFPDDYRRLWNLPYTWPVAGEVDRATAAAAVAELVRTNEGLRTTFVLDDDSGELIQRIHAPRMPPIVEVPYDDQLKHRRQFPKEFSFTPFDLVQDWPSRFAFAVDENGIVRVAAMVTNHAISDAWARRLMSQQVKALLAAGGDPAAWTGRRVQPADIAADEHSPAGMARRARAAEYMRQQLQMVPTTLFPHRPARAEGAEAEPPLVWPERNMAYVGIQSPAMYYALRHLRKETRLPITALILAPYTALLAHHTGHDVISWNAMVNNRADPFTRDAVVCLTQPVIITCDTAGEPSFTKMAARCHSALLRGYRHARYDVREIEKLIVAEGERRGAPLAIDRVFDYWDRNPEVVLDHPPTLEQLDVSASSIKSHPEGWRGRGPEQSLRVWIDDDSVDFWLWADTDCLPEAELRRLLLGVEAALVGACTGQEWSVPEIARGVGLAAPVAAG
jgi:hypothetical protein